jgi:hypothetical protein
MAQVPSGTAIIGAGAVAQALGRSMLAAGLPLVAVASRTRVHAEQAAGFINGAARAASTEGVRTANLSEIPRLASHILIAVADQGIGPVADALAAAGMRTGIALHTCGAKGPDALQAPGACRAACCIRCKP